MRALPWVLVVALLAVTAWGYRRDVGARAALTTAKANYRAAKLQVRVDSVRLIRTVERTRTLRDTLTLRLTDTIAVREYIRQTDTLVQRCMACLASASAVVVASDTVFVKLAANARRLTDRFGVTVGYGALVAGQVRTGPVVSVSVRIWP